MNGSRKPRRRPPPLDKSSVDELALAYVARFATTRAKLRAYLARKVRERGWAGPGDPEVDQIAERLSDQGYIDDAAFALSKAQALSSRGFGKRRVADKLRSSGVGDADGVAALAHADSQGLAAAVRFAERRRIGPFATAPATDPRTREKWIAAMVRGGHGFDTARAIASLPPGSDVDLEELADRLRFTAM